MFYKAPLTGEQYSALLSTGRRKVLASGDCLKKGLVLIGTTTMV
ncbi:MAG: hypothetical protein PHQ67_06445 [Fermentimonas sp.]|nr:hypothetical protein [Fermentimonas sp.]